MAGSDDEDKPKPMANFMFGNVDKKGDLEDEKYDSETRKNLNTLKKSNQLADQVKNIISKGKEDEDDNYDDEDVGEVEAAQDAEDFSTIKEMVPMDSKRLEKKALGLKKKDDDDDDDYDAEDDDEVAKAIREKEAAEEAAAAKKLQEAIRDAHDKMGAREEISLEDEARSNVDKFRNKTLRFMPLFSQEEEGEHVMDSQASAEMRRELMASTSAHGETVEESDDEEVYTGRKVIGGVGDQDKDVAREMEKLREKAILKLKMKADKEALNILEIRKRLQFRQHRNPEWRWWMVGEDDLDEKAELTHDGLYAPAEEQIGAVLNDKIAELKERERERRRARGWSPPYSEDEDPHVIKSRIKEATFELLEQREWENQIVWSDDDEPMPSKDGPKQSKGRQKSRVKLKLLPKKADEYEEDDEEKAFFGSAKPAPTTNKREVVKDNAKVVVDLARGRQGAKATAQEWGVVSEGPGAEELNGNDAEETRDDKKRRKLNQNVSIIQRLAGNRDFEEGGWMDKVVWDEEELPRDYPREPVIINLNDTSLIVNEVDGDDDDDDVDDANLLNIGNDSYYERVVEGGQNMAVFSKHVRHTPMADKMGFFPVGMEDEFMRYLHKPVNFFQPHNTYKVVTNAKFNSERGDQKKMQDVDKIKHKAFLNSRDTDIVVVEYTEEHPPFINTVGMGCCLATVYKKQSPDDDYVPDQIKGMKDPPLTVESSAEVPIMGDVDPGKSITLMFNNLFKVPVFEHGVFESDFLLILPDGSKKHGDKHNWCVIREIPSLFTGCMMHPKEEVWSKYRNKPNSNDRYVDWFQKRRVLQLALKSVHRKMKELEKIKDSIKDKKDLARREEDARSVGIDEIQASWSTKDNLKNLRSHGFKTEREVTYKLKKEVQLKSEREVNQMIKAEEAVQYCSFRMGCLRLSDAGVKNIHDSENKHAMESSERNKIKWAPWWWTQNWLAAETNNASKLALPVFELEREARAELIKQGSKGTKVNNKHKIGVYRRRLERIIKRQYENFALADPELTDEELGDDEDMINELDELEDQLEADGSKAQRDSMKEDKRQLALLAKDMRAHEEKEEKAKAIAKAETKNDDEGPSKPKIKIKPSKAAIEKAKGKEEVKKEERQAELSNLDAIPEMPEEIRAKAVGKVLKRVERDPDNPQRLIVHYIRDPGLIEMYLKAEQDYGGMPKVKGTERKVKGKKSDKNKGTAKSPIKIESLLIKRKLGEPAPQVEEVEVEPEVNPLATKKLIPVFGAILEENKKLASSMVQDAFHKAVKEKVIVDYYEIIPKQQSMNFANMVKKLKNDKYTSWSTFLDDIIQIRTNAHQYYERGAHGHPMIPRAADALVAKTQALLMMDKGLAEVCATFNMDPPAFDVEESKATVKAIQEEFEEQQRQYAAQVAAAQAPAAPAPAAQHEEDGNGDHIEVGDAMDIDPAS